jgi:hypothetical protein
MNCPICGSEMVYDPEDNMFVCGDQLMEQEPHKEKVSERKQS